MDDKSNSLKKDLTRALSKLKEALAAENTELNRDATIQRFEFTFELSWKFMQSIIQENRIEAYGVKSVIREAVALGLIPQPEPWFEFLDTRNRTVHTYNAEMAEQIYNEIKSFPPLVDQFLTKTI